MVEDVQLTASAYGAEIANDFQEQDKERLIAPVSFQRVWLAHDPCLRTCLGQMLIPGSRHRLSNTQQQYPAMVLLRARLSVYILTAVHRDLVSLVVR